jgi:hypothetical protein
MAEQVIPVDIGGSTVLVEATVSGSEEEIAGLGLPSFRGVQEAIESIAGAVTAALQKAAPKKATVEFGCQVAMEGGQLTALLVKGTGSASLKITLEWGGSD